MVLIQCLTTIVLFLLTFFWAADDCGCIGRRVTLPRAVNTLALVTAPMVAINGSQILVNDHPVGSTRDLVAEGRVRPRLDELFNALKTLKDDRAKINPDKANFFPGVVILEVNEDVPAVVVVSVYRTCAAAGYTNVSLMVEQAGERR